MNKTNKPLDTRERLRQLMSRHTAAAAAKPAPPVAPVPASKPAPINAVPRPRQPDPAPASSFPPAALPKTVVQGERCTVRLLPVETAKVDQTILQTHQTVGQRITMSDVLRIGLARITATAPITAEEISALRATHGRRKMN